MANRDMALEVRVLHGDDATAALEDRNRLALKFSGDDMQAIHVQNRQSVGLWAYDVLALALDGTRDHAKPHGA